MLFGDSHAQGLNTQMSRFAAEQGVPYVGNGKVGSRMPEWSVDPWLDATIASFRPTLIMVSLGTNDAAIGPGAAARQHQGFEQLLTKLKASGADIVWIGPPTLPFPDQGVPDMIRAEVPYWFPSAEYEIPRGPDNLHATARGYAGWAAAIWNWLS